VTRTGAAPAGAPVVTDEPEGFLPVLTSAVRRRWTASVFGIVAPGAVRRRPSDIGRVVTAAAVLGAISAGASVITTLEEQLFELLTALPGGLTGLLEALFLAAPVVAGVLVVSALVARRPRLLLTLLIAGALGWTVAAGLSALVDVPRAVLEAGDQLDRYVPDFPVIPLAASFGVLLAARPYVTRPARRLLSAVIWMAGIAAVFLAAGLPMAVIASLVLAWGAAAAAHLALGSPGGTPSLDQVRESLRELGVETEVLQLDLEQTWGHTSFVDPAGGRSVEVVGRDSTDARLLAKLWRFVWYKDAGPTLTLGRSQQVEHSALVLLLAERSGARVPELVAVGVAGARDDALLVVQDPPGRPLGDHGEGLDDEVLADVWANLARLHAAQIAHGALTGRRIVVDGDGRSGLTRLDQAETSAPDEHLALDRVQLLVTTADQVGTDRALDAAEQALSSDTLAALLPLLEPAALSGRQRSHIDDLKDLLGELREAGSARTGVEVPRPTALRRFSLGNILLAAAFALGVYLLVAQLAGVAAMGDVFQGAIIPWVVTTAVLAQLPQFFQAIAMLGAVAVALPLRPVTVVQFANAFTGLVGGTAGNTTLVIRFFQKQGLSPSVAVSSGLLNSIASFVCQLVLVLIGLVVTGDSFDVSTGGRSLPGWLLAVILAVLVAVAVVLLVARLRRRLLGFVTEQVAQAWGNIRGVISTPGKAVQLFGGQVCSQLLFAMTLGAALHAYGQSLPLLEIVVVNSLASFVGGAAPVPGGMGVVEAGLIAGFTSAGIPQAEAVAAVFTARTFTTYLPPIWGWFAFQWLRHHDYV
jgi:glycosyltransferase 2 family protein